MKRTARRQLILAGGLTLGLLGLTGMGQDFGVSDKPRITTTRERLPPAGAPVEPRIEVPVVVDTEEPEMPESTIAQPVPPTPPVPPTMQEPPPPNPMIQRILPAVEQLLKPAPPPPPPAKPGPTSAAPVAEPPHKPRGMEHLIQVGAMLQVENALSLVEKCQEKGFEAFHVPPDNLGGLHRVMIGPFSTRDRAVEVATQWKALFKGNTILTTRK